MTVHDLKRDMWFFYLIAVEGFTSVFCVLNATHMHTDTHMGSAKDKTKLSH